jgi:hypothetical protein
MTAAEDTIRLVLDVERPAESDPTDAPGASSSRLCSTSRVLGFAE